MSTEESLFKAFGAEICGAGDSDESIGVPDAHRDGAALSGFQLLRFAAVDLDRAVLAAGSSKIPLTDSGLIGQSVKLVLKGRCVQLVVGGLADGGHVSDLPP